MYSQAPQPMQRNVSTDGRSRSPTSVILMASTGQRREQTLQLTPFVAEMHTERSISALPTALRLRWLSDSGRSAPVGQTVPQRLHTVRQNDLSNTIVGFIAFAMPYSSVAGRRTPVGHFSMQSPQAVQRRRKTSRLAAHGGVMPPSRCRGSPATPATFSQKASAPDNKATPPTATHVLSTLRLPTSMLCRSFSVILAKSVTEFFCQFCDFVHLAGDENVLRTVSRTMIA